MGFTLNQLEQERQIRKLQKKEDKDTSNYEQLSNLPKINNVELKGDKTGSDLGLVNNSDMTAQNVAYNNTGTGLTATDVQGAIDEVNTRLAANTFGTVVDIKGTTGYTCPSDGYIKFRNDGSSTGNTYLSVLINNEPIMGLYAQHLGYYEVVSLFVKKGMVIKDSDTTLSSYDLKFIPIS